VLHGILYSVIVTTCSACGVTVVLEDPRLWGSLMVNPNFRGRRGGSCAWAWMTLRVVLTSVYVWLSSVHRFKGAPMLDRGSC
jgi:hypothetical protein